MSADKIERVAFSCFKERKIKIFFIFFFYFYNFRFFSNSSVSDYIEFYGTHVENPHFNDMSAKPWVRVMGRFADMSVKRSFIYAFPKIPYSVVPYLRKGELCQVLFVLLSIIFLVLICLDMYLYFVFETIIFRWNLYALRLPDKF